MDPDTIVSEETSPMELPWPVTADSNDQMHSRLEQLGEFTAAGTRDGVAASDVIIQPETGVWARIYTPHRSEITGPALPNLQLPVFFYFHGGGFAFVSANCLLPDSFSRYLCKTFQALVVSVDYRYPTAYDDCYAAVQWLITEALPEADLSRCFLVGESAGGNIVHHVACRIASDEVIRGKLTVLGNLVFAPFFGGEERTPAELRLLKIDPILDYFKCDPLWEKYLPAGASRDHPAANIACPQAPDLTGLPLAPFLVTVGEYDSLKDWQIRYAKTLKSMGQHVQVILYKGGVHCFHVMPELALSSRFRADLEHFVHSKLSPPTVGDI